MNHYSDRNAGRQRNPPLPAHSAAVLPKASAQCRGGRGGVRGCALLQVAGWRRAPAASGCPLALPQGCSTACSFAPLPTHALAGRSCSQTPPRPQPTHTPPCPPTPPNTITLPCPPAPYHHPTPLAAPYPPRLPACRRCLWRAAQGPEADQEGAAGQQGPAHRRAVLPRHRRQGHEEGPEGCPGRCRPVNGRTRQQQRRQRRRGCEGPPAGTLRKQHWLGRRLFVSPPVRLIFPAPSSLCCRWCRPCCLARLAS